MNDYAENLIKISEYRRKAQLAILDKNWSEACDYLDLIIDSAKDAKIYSMEQLDEILKTRHGKSSPTLQNGAI
jgi:CTP:phosphocholine cytidylyltransferase-like protein